MRNIFVISGLGADETVFYKLKFPGYTLIHIRWVETVKGESMNDYARRLLPQITEDNPIVMGLSLGGMLALEVSKLIPVESVISISSATTYKELPFHYKLAGWLRLQKILPVYTFSRGNKITHWLFGAKSKQDKEVLNNVFKNLDRDFLYWALNAVLNWDNLGRPENLFRVHGTADLILPRNKKASYNHVISGGTHLMLMDLHEDVSQTILAFLNPK